MILYRNTIKKLQKKIHIDFNILIKMLPKEDYNMFNIIDIDSVLDNKIFLDKIFNKFYFRFSQISLNIGVADLLSFSVPSTITVITYLGLVSG